MKDMKLSNIQKESEKIKIKKSINEYEDLKSQALLQLGIKTFDKIRKKEIESEDFNEICEEIRNYDIEIYTKYMQLKNFEVENKKTTCECGYVAFKNEKFCPQCGNNLVEKEETYIVCSTCNQQIEEDSNFCGCCGSKIEKIKDICEYESNDEELNYEDEIIDLYEDEEVEEFDMVENNKIELSKEEVHMLNDDIAIDEENVQEDFLENEGREFLKQQEEDNIK